MLLHSGSFLLGMYPQICLHLILQLEIMKKIWLYILITFPLIIKAQTPPWEQPLKIAHSTDGITFTNPAIFQDSAGVPCVIRWKGDTLISAFQWFRAPQGSSTWDRVAVKFSYNNGLNWTNPVPIVVNGIPVNYQRPFDPTLLKLNNDSLRIFFSSSDGMPAQGLDSTINTYSAVSADGIHYSFENTPRVDHPSNRVIDPAVIFFNNACHYLAPIGSPQQGAYHYISPNAFIFNQVPDIPSDNFHNWTGNYMVNDSNELRFYGSGSQNIWFNSSPNGGVWNGYTNTNIQGGDPSVLKISNNDYLMIYVGAPYITNISEPIQDEPNKITLFPNPANHTIYIHNQLQVRNLKFAIYNVTGQQVLYGIHKANGAGIAVENLENGFYFLWLEPFQYQKFQIVH